MRPPSADDRTYVPADERSFCADCSGEIGMLRVSRTVLRLGHISAPATLHAPRLARSSSDLHPGAVPATSEAPNVSYVVPDERPDRRRGGASFPSDPERRGVEPGSSPRPGSAPALRAGGLSAAGGGGR